MQETAINWTKHTWNPASGCVKISPGCKHCYAETLAEKRRGTSAFPVGFDPMIRPWKLREPVNLEKREGPSLIFLNSTSDLFMPQYLAPLGDLVDEHAKYWPRELVGEVSREDCYVDLVLRVVNRTHHRYQVLTKRPELAAEYFSRRPCPRNVWMGTTIERDDYVQRADELRKIDALVRFISAEPLLGPLPHLDLAGIHWLITGGESGDHLAKIDERAKRAMAEPVHLGKGAQWQPKPDRMYWIRDLRDRCALAGVAFWHKQWGGVRPESAGRTLDGRTHDGMPVHVAGAMPEGYGHAAKRGQQSSLPVIGGAS